MNCHPVAPYVAPSADQTTYEVVNNAIDEALGRHTGSIR